jgi:hypothetical protein
MFPDEEGWYTVQNAGEGQQDNVYLPHTEEVAVVVPLVTRIASASVKLLPRAIHLSRSTAVARATVHTTGYAVRDQDSVYSPIIDAWWLRR